MKPRAVFLDVGGVITTDNPDPDCVFPISKKKTGFLADIVTHGQVKLVLSSSWRFFEGEKAILKVYFRQCFQLELFDETPKVGSRAEEIMLWLEDNEVDDYLVLDDSPIAIEHMRDRGYGEQHLHHVKGTGLNMEDRDSIIQRLEQGPKTDGVCFDKVFDYAVNGVDRFEPEIRRDPRVRPEVWAKIKQVRAAEKRQTKLIRELEEVFRD